VEPATVSEFLKVPRVESAHFARNFIRQAVCELRFPTLLELETKAPVAFQKAIRHEYPTYERNTDISLNAAGVAQAAAHRFRSKKGKWTVTLRQSALSLETTAYDSFADFARRLKTLIGEAGKTIDSNFFTRIGLRYINALDVSQDDVDGWVQGGLVAPLVAGIYGGDVQFWQEVRGHTEIGGYLFRHGLAQNPANSAPEYVLDFDFFAEDVELVKADEVIAELHRREYDFFHWCLGPRALEHLGPSTK
jgi:uncharacterized protein (TIGR04255 family)